MGIANGFIGSEDVRGVDEDKKVNQLSPGIDGIGEGWAGSECDTTVLDDGDDDEDRDDEEGRGGEWYDSDDTAFDYEDDDTCKSGALPELALKIEPEGAWISDEVSTVGEPW